MTRSRLILASREHDDVPAAAEAEGDELATEVLTLRDEAVVGISCERCNGRNLRRTLLRGSLSTVRAEPGAEHVDEGNHCPRQVPRGRVQRVERPLL